MKIINLPIDEIIPYERNPRKNDGAVEAVAASIREFGFKVPIVIDAQNVIVTGHTRHKAARKLGLTECPCIRADDLTPEQVRAYRLADNKVAELAEWDFDLLAAELAELPDFDFAEMGFERVSPDDFGEDFSLDDSDEPQFQEITFIQSKEQLNDTKRIMSEIKREPAFKAYHEETGGNINGNVLGYMVQKWEEQKI